MDWGSAGYGRTSRVKNNHLLVTNPVFTSGTASLINLSNGSKIIYSSGAVNFTQIRENNFDNIYFGNQVLNTANGIFNSPLPLNSAELIEYFDSISHYTVTTNYSNLTATGNYTSYLSIYNNQNKIFQSSSASGRSFYVPRILQITNNTILYYQYFGYGTTFNIDGYYSIDLNTNKITLIQSDNSSPYIINDFQLDAKQIISVRYDGVYLLSKL